MKFVTVQPSDFPGGTSLSSISGWSTHTYGLNYTTGQPSDGLSSLVATGGNFVWQTPGGNMNRGYCIWPTGQSDYRVYADMQDGNFICGAATGQGDFVAFIWQANGDGSYAFYAPAGPVVGNVEQGQGNFTLRINKEAKFPPITRVGIIHNSNGTLSFTFNGRSAEKLAALGLLSSTAGGPLQYPLPASIAGSTGGGFGTSVGPHSQASFMQVRDSNDILIIEDVDVGRFNANLSRLKVSGTSNVTGATMVTITVLGADGVLCSGPATVPIVNGAWIYDVRGGLVIPTVNETSVLTVHATTTGTSVTDTNDVRFYMPATVPGKPVEIGINNNYAVYFTKNHAVRDMIKAVDWTYTDANHREWFVAPDEIDLGNWSALGGNGSISKSQRDCLDANGLPCFSDLFRPIRWHPGGDDIRGKISYWLDATWLEAWTVLKLAPGLDFAIGFVPDNAITIQKNLDTGLHRIKFHTQDLDLAALILLKNQAIGPSGNYGLPTTQWDMTWRLEGDNSPYLLNDGYVNAKRASGGSIERFMKGEYGEPDQYTHQPGRFTAASRTKPADGCWQRSGRSFLPWEAKIELCNRAHKHAYFALPPLCEESYVRALAQVCRALSPGLKVYLEPSNEVWNDQYACGNMYALFGLQTGLGAITVGQDGTYTATAVYGVDNGSYFPNGFLPSGSPPMDGYTPPENWQANAGYSVGYRLRHYASVWRCIQAVPANSSAATPDVDRTHWVLEHDWLLAKHRAHQQDGKRIAAIFADEIGAAQAYRLQPCGAWWQNAFSNTTQIGTPIVDIYLTWGAQPGTTDIRQLMVGGYWFPYRGDYTNLSPSQQATPAGAQRVQMFRELLTGDVTVTINEFDANARYLFDRMQALGIPADSCALGIYECGWDMQWYNWPDQATDEALLADITTIHRDVMGDMTYFFLTSIADKVGGVFVFFIDIDSLPFKLNSGYASYAVMNDAQDRASPPYVALRDVSLAYGGQTYPDEFGNLVIPTRVRRRMSCLRTLH